MLQVRALIKTRRMISKIFILFYRDSNPLVSYLPDKGISFIEFQTT